LYVLLVLASAVFLGSESLGTYCLRFETSLFVASYDSQGHGGGIRSRLHTGIQLLLALASLYRLGSDHSTENISVAQQWIYANHIKDTSCYPGSIVACVYCRPCLEMGLLHCW
jgi:hypothetical protein